MTTPFQRGMAQATQLTRSGNLQGATDLIRSLLLGQKTQAEAPHPPTQDDVIDGTCTPLPPIPPLSQGTATKQAPEPAAQKATSPMRKTAKTVKTPLSETLRKIAAGGMPAQGPLAQGPLSPPTATLPPGAAFLSLSHRSEAGQRDYRLYVPAHRPEGPLPLIVLLHGCTQSPEDFALGTQMNSLAETFGCLVAYPAQPIGANAQKCWNWFRPEDQARGHGEPALIAGLARDIQQTHNADPARTYIAGLSAGGAAAIIAAAAYPDVFAAAGTHSGLPAGGARDIPSAFAAMRNGTKSPPHPIPLPTIVFHGLSDTTVHPDNGTASIAQVLPAMPGLRQNRRAETAPGGRRYQVTSHHHPDGRSLAEHWEIHGSGHAWSGGHPKGSYTDPSGPDASAQMLRFFLQHRRS